MAELNYATSCESMDALINSMTTSASNLSFASPNHLIIPNANEGKQRGRYKKDALEHVDYLKEYLVDPKYKTEMCKTWSESGFCAYGNKCRFAHGKHELFNKQINCKKYKQKECTSFFKNNFCCYGSRCHFRHLETKFEDLPRSYHSLLLETIRTLRKRDIEDKPVEEVFKLLHFSDTECPVKRLQAFTQVCSPAPKLPFFKSNATRANRYLKSIEQHPQCKYPQFNLHHNFNPVSLF